ncbi:polysaccharide biosynthesis C-terminal domain-containing protein [uncultured Dialister sp.]|jgi:O-antigen/teichoic acid export membrane protein|uniref:polysaccharide biosynthesis C-terminal domain-containing protein n=1 Tax=uncultured Dialister sp. TaxID=278064 RepID=UPI00265EEBC9|nr:polysaccharide biosynthesis C-terminal domain-containing protein [uncultured Dialister sp.]
MNYMALSTAISGVYLPHVTGMVARKEPIRNLSELFIQIGRWQYYLLALVATGFIIFGKQFIALWAGPGFEDSYIITLLIILPFTVDLIQNIGLAIMQAMNRYDFRARIYFLTGVLNLLLAIPLGIKYGGIGCAVATGISMIVGNGFIMNWYYAKEMHLAIASFWKQIGKISFITFMCLVIGYWVNTYIGPYGGIYPFILKVVMYTILYVVMIYFFAMNLSEREKVHAVFHKLHIS